MSLLIIQYNMFCPTWPSSGNTKNMQNAYKIYGNISINRISLTFIKRIIKLNVAINLASILHIFCISWRWPSWTKHAV